MMIKISKSLVLEQQVELFSEMIENGNIELTEIKGGVYFDKEILNSFLAEKVKEEFDKGIYDIGGIEVQFRFKARCQRCFLYDIVAYGELKEFNEDTLYLNNFEIY